MDKLKMLIGGQWLESASGEYVDDVNPANCQVVARVSRGDREDVDRVVESAAEAFTSE